MKQIIQVLLLLGCFYNVTAQTADVTKGCSPLAVNFTAPNQSSYYWTFQEGGATAVSQNPQHIFTNPGEYVVTLYDGQGGAKIGEITIKVYKDPDISITGEPISGCSPLKVLFKSTIELDPEVSITGYKWTFGDGNQSNLPNPEHIYSNAGSYDVSLEVTTNLLECNKTEIFFKYISVAGVQADFSLNKESGCSAPVSLTATNSTVSSPDYQYLWDFGNGVTSSQYNPGAITFSAEGNYNITLSVTNAEGCVSTKSLVFNIGKPKFDIEPPKEVCLREQVFISNNTGASFFEWEFVGGSVQSSNERVPSIVYTTPGNKQVKLTAFDDQNCKVDTSFIIVVQVPNADFIFDSLITCVEPMPVNLKAINQTYSEYEWLIEKNWIVPVDTGRISSFNFIDFDRDSLYLHERDTLFINLIVKTTIGCIDTVEKLFIHQKPNAHFKPNVAKGCAPLTVSFEDLSNSNSEIISYKYIYDTGDEFSPSSNAPHSYTFQNPGDYFVKNIIENKNGCIDTSAGVWIRVGEPIVPDFEVDKTEICIGESISVTFSNADPRIDAIHLESDDGRFDHCWTMGMATHTFTTLPGIYPVIGVAEYNGCYSTINAPFDIKVNGAKADIGYMINCDTPYDLMLIDESTGEDVLQWSLEDTIYNNIEQLTHTFADRGVYKVVLEASDSQSGCPSTFDSVEVHITDIKADFELDSLVCENNFYILSAANSRDVNATCHKGYLWYLPTKRPLEYENDTISTNFPSGDNAVTLVVEDINGCTDQITKYTRSFAIDPSFTIDKDKICLPATITLTNTSTSDTTIASYDWLGTYTDESVTIDVTEDDLQNGVLYLTLELVDVLGCKQGIVKELEVYQPSTQLAFDPGFNLCVGDELTFSASDFTSEGSYLNFNWNIEGYGDFVGQSHTIVINDNGQKQFTLIYEEESSGCRDTLQDLINVVNVPIADFSSDADGINPLCHPRIIGFTSQSTIDGPGTILWNFSNAPSTNLLNPSQAFGKGTYEVEIVARSIFGCTDTLKKFYTLVGPEGEVITDKTKICIGDEVEFTMINPVEVNEYQWDFGDGTTAENINPIIHKFEREQTTTAKLILKTAANTCDLVIEIPLDVDEVFADFEVYDTATYCEGQVFIKDLSSDDLIKEWNTGTGIIEDSNNPFKLQYPSAGAYEITLKVINSLNGCENILTKSIVLDAIGELYKVPNLFTPNNDGENDLFRPIILNEDFIDIIKIASFKVYNRWGNLVYDNADPNLGWDGMYQGTIAPAEVYAYYLELEVVGCNSLTKKGNVTLMR